MTSTCLRLDQSHDLSVLLKILVQWNSARSWPAKSWTLLVFEAEGKRESSGSSNPSRVAQFSTSQWTPRRFFWGHAPFLSVLLPFCPIIIPCFPFFPSYYITFLLYLLFPYVQLNFLLSLLFPYFFQFILKMALSRSTSNP